MKSKKILKTVLLVVLVLTFIFTTFYLTSKKMDKVEVYRFKHTIEANVLIEEDDIEKTQITRTDKKDDMITNKKDVVGKYTSSLVHATHFIYNVSIIDVDEIDPFKNVDFSLYEKIPVPLDYVTGFGGDLKPGDKVDFYFINEGTTKDGFNDEFVYSKKFMADIIVYKVLTEEGFRFVEHTNFSNSEAPDNEELTGETISTSTTDEELGLVVVLMTSNQVEEFLAREYAGVIRISGNFDESIDFETEGYVVGTYSEIYSGENDVETDESTSYGIESDVKNKDESDVKNKDESDTNKEAELPSLGDIIDFTDEDVTTEEDKTEE